MTLWRAVALVVIGIGLNSNGLAAQNPSQDSAGTKDTTAAPMTVRPSQAMPGSYNEPSCLSSSGLRKVNDAVTSLKDALKAETPAARTEALQHGRQSVLETITKEKKDDNASAWYILGLTYLYQDSIVGADSALRHAGSLAPGCKSSLEELRYRIWAPLINTGITFTKTKNNDSALVVFREAATIYPEKPHAALNAGVIFANSGQLDSAIVYFRLAADAAERAKLVPERNQATFNLAAMLQQSSRHAEAAQALEKYVAWVPNDREAKDALATSYRASGQVEKAQALEKELLAAAGAPTQAGTADSAAASATTKDSAAAGSKRTGVSASMAMRLGVNFYNDQKYSDAASAFRKVLETEPNNRDAIYNLANTYLAMKDGAGLVDAGGRLMAIEPMSEASLQLLGTGYRYINDLDKAVKIAEQLVALPADVTVKEFMVRSDGAKLTMNAVGRAAQTAAGKAIPPTAVPVTFEFLNGQGAVVATQDAEVPALKSEQAGQFVVDVQGKGIIAWRYRVK